MSAVRTNRKSGQGMTEYIIILAIIAIGAILIVGIFGKQIKAAFGKSSGAMAGKAAAEAKDSEVTKDSQNQNDMGTFDDTIGK